MPKTFNSDLDAILYLEQEENQEEEDVIAAYQRLVDSGVIWSLQGSYQRGVLPLIEAGLVVRP
jgi:hypothetical protein